MPTRHRVLPNLYRDSVTLMQLSSTLASMKGVSQAYALMGTPANLDLLRDAGVSIEGLQAKPNDLIVVVEASGGSYSPEGAGRVSMSTGNPTLLGWDFHERQWRGDAYDELAAGRPEALDSIYRTARPDELAAVLARWNVDYVYVGDLERKKFGIGDAGLARLDGVLSRVYDSDGVILYAR